MTTTQHALFGDDKTVRPRKKRTRFPEDRGQLAMFSQKEIGQFGAGLTAWPWPGAKLQLAHQDLAEETEEEKSARMQTEAEARTAPMFKARPRYWAWIPD